MDSTYFDMQEEGRERTAYFVLDSLLKSRIECGFESNSTRYDEDVNVYLVHLLSGLVESPHLGMHAADRDIDVFGQVRESCDARFKSLVYRTNADHQLLMAGIFTGTPYSQRNGQRVYEDSTRERIGRGKAYYQYASSLQGRVPAASKTFADVLDALSQDFERYVDVLFHMRGEYFHLYRRILASQWMGLESECASEVEEDSIEPIDALRNEFLDAYVLWQSNRTPETRSALADCADKLRKVDPNFDFIVPE